jgi:hypothetical protein
MGGDDGVVLVVCRSHALGDHQSSPEWTFSLFLFFIEKEKKEKAYHIISISLQSCSCEDMC